MQLCSGKSKLVLLDSCGVGCFVVSRCIQCIVLDLILFLLQWCVWEKSGLPIFQDLICSLHADLSILKFFNQVHN